MSDSVRMITKDKKTTNVSIEEIENGFIITRNVEYQDDKGEWHYETKKWYNEDNPLNKEEKSLSDMFD